jgi:two-component system, NarL family, sensor kinase
MRFLFFLLLQIVLLVCNGQSKKDSLINELTKKNFADTQRVKTLTSIALIYMADSPRKMLFYANEALTLAQKINFKKGEATAHYFAGISYLSLQVKDSGVYHYEKAIPIYESLGMYLYSGGCYRDLARLIYERGDRNKGLKYYIKSSEHFEKAGDKKGKALAAWDMAIAYTSEEQYEKALEQYDVSLKLLQELKDTQTYQGLFSGKATVKRYMKQYDEALALNNQSLELGTKLNNTGVVNYALHEIGTCYLFKKEYNKAITTLTDCIKRREADNETDELGYSYNYLGEAYTGINDYSNAKKAFENGLSVAKKIGNTKQEMESYFYLAGAYEKLGDFSNAFIFQKKYNVLNDSLTKINKSKEFTELQTQYETAKKEKQIQQQQFEISKKNYFLYGTVGLALLLSIIGYSFYKRKKLQQEAKLQQEIIKQQDLSTKAVLEAEEKERERIARDLHDGVGQVMSAAKMNLSAFESELSFKDENQKLQFEKVINLVDEGCKEVRNVSHQMMPNALLKAGLSSAIKEFIDKIDSPSLKVNLYTEGLNERLDNNTETVLYRVIQECVNNVIKHSGANQLDISLLKDEDGISATIEDNGKGFDGKATVEGIGLKNIKTRIEFLKGTVDFDSSVGKGTLVAIHVPIDK